MPFQRLRTDPRGSEDSSSMFVWCPNHRQGDIVVMQMEQQKQGWVKGAGGQVCACVRERQTDRHQGRRGGKGGVRDRDPKKERQRPRKNRNRESERDGDTLGGEGEGERGK